MERKFEVAVCRSDRAGKAHLSVTHGNGVEIAIQHLPFECDPAEELGQEQQRILADAARLARSVADFLETQSRVGRVLPIHQDKPGPAPQERAAPE